MLIGGIDKFCKMAKEDRFKGWSVVGVYEYGDKIPFFGQTLSYNLQTPDGIKKYTSILRHFGWSVVFGVIQYEGKPHVITLVQWKPGVNCASWELPPGGIGKVPSGISDDGLLLKTRESYLKETGYGNGDFDYLGFTMIETGKYRGADLDDHGLKAHMYLATNLEKIQDARNPNTNEIMETLLVPLDEFTKVLDSDYFTETSAVACAYKALVKLGYLNLVHK